MCAQNTYVHNIYYSIIKSNIPNQKNEKNRNETIDYGIICGKEITIV